MVRHQVSSAVRSVLLASAMTFTGLSVSPAALAQDQADKDTLQEVVVTGSRIVRQDFVSNSPLTTVTAEQITQQQDITLDTFLNTLPQVNPAGTTTSNNPGNGGRSNVNLRGLGANRNLVLIDGRRAMVSASDQTVDLNTIPAALIESIEVITGGAGAVYGADAVAGAVNIKLKRNFEGLDVRLGYGDATETRDAREYNASATMGANFGDGKGNVAIGFEYSNREGLIKSQRDFAAVATATTTFLPEGLYFPSATNPPTQAAVDAVFAGYGVPAGSVPASLPLIGFNLDGTLFSRGIFNSPLDVRNFRYPIDLSVNTRLFPDVYSYNFDSVNILTLPLERRSMMAKFNYELSDAVEVFSQFGYTQYDSTTALAPTPIPTVSIRAPGFTTSPSQATSPLVTAAINPSTPGIGFNVANQLIVPVTNPFIPAAFRTILASRTGDDPALVGSGATEPFTMRQRTLSAGLRQSVYTNTVTQYLLGARGDLPFGNNWRWEGYASEGRTEIAQTQTGNINTQRLQGLLEAADGGASQCTGGFNPFGRQPVSQSCLNFLEVKNTLTRDFKLQVLQAFVSGDVAQLPAGALALVLGAEYRGFRYSFDPGAASGPISGFNAQDPASGNNRFKDLFTEIYLPLLKDASFAQSLDVTLGFRRSRSDFKDAVKLKTAGSSDDAYKVELGWQPIESVRARLSYQRAVRAPNFGELFDGSLSAPQYFDPCSVTTDARRGPNGAALRLLCQARGLPGTAVDSYVQSPGTQLQTTLSGNTDAGPETADTVTLGVVFAPAWTGLFEGLRASVDYYKIDIDDALVTPDSNLFVADCFNYYGNNPMYDPNYVNCLPSRLVRSGDLVQVRGPGPGGVFQTLNQGEISTDGVDITVDWARNLGPGRLSTQLYLNYLLGWEQLSFAGFPKIDFAGTVTFFGAGDGLGQTFPELRANLALAYAIGKFTVDGRVRFIDGMDNRASVLFPGESSFTGTPSVTYLDLGFKYDVTDWASVRLGVNNALNKEPPVYAPNVQSGTDPSTYDVIGRRAFLQVNMKF